MNLGVALTFLTTRLARPVLVAHLRLHYTGHLDLQILVLLDLHSFGKSFKSARFRELKEVLANPSLSYVDKLQIKPSEERIIVRNYFDVIARNSVCKFLSGFLVARTA